MLNATKQVSYVKCSMSMEVVKLPELALNKNIVDSWLTGGL